MLEINVTVNAPGISEAINNLAAAINSKNEAVSVQNAPLQAASTAPSTVCTPVPTAPATPTTPAPAPQTVTPTAPTPTVETLGRAGAALCEQGKMPQLIELLNKYGVQTVVQLKGATPEVLISFANDLKALGAVL